jgi:hypothetical protein
LNESSARYTVLVAPRPNSLTISYLPTLSMRTFACTTLSLTLWVKQPNHLTRLSKDDSQIHPQGARRGCTKGRQSTTQQAACGIDTKGLKPQQHTQIGYPARGRKGKRTATRDSYYPARILRSGRLPVQQPQHLQGITVPQGTLRGAVLSYWP